MVRLVEAEDGTVTEVYLGWDGGTSVMVDVFYDKAMWDRKEMDQSGVRPIVRRFNIEDQSFYVTALNKLNKKERREYDRMIRDVLDIAFRTGQEAEGPYGLTRQHFKQAPNPA